MGGIMMNGRFLGVTKRPFLALFYVAKFAVLLLFFNTSDVFNKLIFIVFFILTS